MSELDLNDQLREGGLLDELLSDAEPMAPSSVDPTASRFFVNDKGTFEHRESGAPRRLCGPLHIVGNIRDKKGGSWSTLVAWNDADGVRHEEPIARTLLAGEGIDAIRILLSGGLGVSRKRDAQAALLDYLGTDGARIRSVERVGWNSGAYVLDGEAFGECAEPIRYVGPERDVKLSSAGTLDEWNEKVAALAAGNSRILLALAAALAAPMLKHLGVEGFGVHLHGPSSNGKTTAALAASSVYSDPDTFKASWRATSNGLEGVAARHNDALLVLDELGECGADAASEAAYMLSNGVGKTRARRDGGAREPARWNTLYLSTGEVTLDDRVRGVGKTTHAGQLVRLLNVPMPSGAHGFFENIHARHSGQAFAEELARATRACYGVAIRPWLRQLAGFNRGDWSDRHADLDAARGRLLSGRDSSQAARVAHSFAALIVAGETAIEHGILKLPPLTVAGAVETCFDAWLEGFGEGNREERAIVEHVRHVLLAHGQSRFESRPNDARQSIPNRMGFTYERGGQKIYAFTSESFKAEVSKGRDHRFVVATLRRLGLLEPSQDREHGGTAVRLPQEETTRRLYEFVASKIEGNES